MDFRDIDTMIWKSELDDFIPGKILDFHCHIFDAGQLAPENIPGHYKKFAYYGNMSQRKYNRILFPGRSVECLFTGWPSEKADLEKQNDFIFSESKKAKGSPMLLLVRPEMGRNYIERQIDKTGAAGFKPYKCFSVSKPEDSAITDFIPHEQLDAANSRGLIITLHLSRKKGISDKDNFVELLELSDKYPDITWNLAHCGRSFIPEFLESEMLQFSELKKRKVYFDISAVTDAEVMFVIIEAMGASRILYGSDNPVGLQRGKCVGFGYDWMFAAEDKFNFKELKESFGLIEPTFILYEQLRALRRACRRAGLSGEYVEDIFYNNAGRLIFPGKGDM